jgi:hypothetical protein
MPTSKSFDRSPRQLYSYMDGADWNSGHWADDGADWGSHPQMSDPDWASRARRGYMFHRLSIKR